VSDEDGGKKKGKNWIQTLKETNLSQGVIERTQGVGGKKGLFDDLH
jgi:hypothetical protein